MSVRRYIVAETARLKPRNSRSRAAPLIFGDEVEVLEDPGSGTARVRFRGREGTVATRYLGDDPALEVYFIDAGQGDSTFVVTPGRRTILVDGGVNDRALRFLAWKYRLNEDDQPPVVIDLLVLSHADADHVRGLTPILGHPRIEVRRVVHSGIAKYRGSSLGKVAGAGASRVLATRHGGLDDLQPKGLTPEFAAWAAALRRQGIPYEAVDRRTGTIDVGDPAVRLEVLGPVLVPVAGNGALGYPWFGDPARTVHGHSVVLKLAMGEVSFLLAGDLNAPGARHLLAQGGADRLAANVLKAPYHGSQEFDTGFLSAVRPQVSVIASGDDPDYGHPPARFLGAVGKASRGDNPLVFSTEIASAFVEDRSGNVRARPITRAERRPRTLKTARLSFKRRLHGMVNVRTDGHRIFAARRIAGTPPWEHYEVDPEE